MGLLMRSAVAFACAEAVGDVEGECSPLPLSEVGTANGNIGIAAFCCWSSIAACCAWRKARNCCMPLPAVAAAASIGLAKGSGSDRPANGVGSAGFATGINGDDSATSSAEVPSKEKPVNSG